MDGKYIIAIDPDCDKSGIAILNTQTKELSLMCMPFVQLMDYFKGVKETLGDPPIYVEAGWLIKSHWHIRKGDNIRVSAAKGNSAGRNHEVGRKIVEIIKHYNLTVFEIPPLPKTYRVGRKRIPIWKGPDGKITHEEFCKETKYKGKTNQECRDAGLIAWRIADAKIWHGRNITTNPI